MRGARGSLITHLLQEHYGKPSLRIAPTNPIVNSVIINPSPLTSD